MLSDQRATPMPISGDPNEFPYQPPSGHSNPLQMHNPHESGDTPVQLQWTGWAQESRPVVQSLPDLQLKSTDGFPKSGTCKLQILIFGPELFFKIEEPVTGPWDGMFLSSWKWHQVFEELETLNGISLYAKLVHHHNGEKRELAFSPSIYLRAQNNKLDIQDETGVDETLHSDASNAGATSNTRLHSELFWHPNIHVIEASEVSDDE